MTVTLRQLQPSIGRLVGNLDTIGGNLDGRNFAPAGTLDSFFDVFVEGELPGLRMINQEPLRMISPSGIYPPAPGQTYFPANPGVLLFDAATGLPAGRLERFDWTPHVAPRLDCDCAKLGIVPIIVSHKEKRADVVASPAPSGAVNGGDAMVYDVEIEVDWAVTIKCSGLGVKCEGTYFPTAVSEDWRKMVLVYEADLKKGEVRIDPLLSNWDGDKKINAADKHPLDPNKH